MTSLISFSGQCVCESDFPVHCGDDCACWHHRPDDPALFEPTTPPMVAPARRRPHRHTWTVYVGEPSYAVCHHCGTVRDEVRARRGKSSRRLGHDGERRSEKRYGWRKVGEYGGITDLEGTLAIVQQKTSRRPPPLAWKGIFAALEGRAGGRVPLILLSFVKQGVDTEDFILIRGRDWIALHGVDAPE